MTSLLLPETRNGEPLLYLFQEEDSQCHQGETVEADNGKNLGKTEIFCGNGLAFAGQIHAGNHLVLLRHILLFNISISEPEALQSGA
jgi:hypothetical protein